MILTVYTRNGCQPCKATIRKINKHGLTYVEKNTSTDEAARDFLIAAGYTQAPVVITSDGREWTDFRPDLIEAIAREEGLL
ncbi:NrdH-like glutaredoxin [Arthrobacter phage Amyev]|uniref:NrdH-like glutaredoxin n=1 Tax=Arthrobacter phage Amyev TaxID=2832315 RepID=A0AA48Y3W9_9CAUD|nr:thioredoxin domain [Arthrobacter phage Amyev]UIW13449.1 NrdH-like glutaredoxin [Arthrobacter phage Amyev]